MLDDAYRTECNIEVAQRELKDMMETKDFNYFRISYAFDCGRYHSIMLFTHGGM